MDARKNQAVPDSARRSANSVRHNAHSTRRIAPRECTRGLSRALDPWSTRTCTPRRPAAPGVLGRHGVSVSATQPLVDVESSLRGIAAPPKDGTLRHIPDVSFDTQDTHQTNPPATLRERGWFDTHVYEELCLNPQDNERIFHQGMTQVPSRLVFKDNHRPRIPVVRDHTNNIDLPASASAGASALPCVETSSVCGAFTGALNQMVFYAHSPEEYAM